MEPAHSRIDLLGRFVVELAGQSVGARFVGHQPRALLAYLVLNRRRPVRREELAALLWAERAPSAPDAALSTLVSRVRKVVGGDVLVGRSELTLMLPSGTVVDTERVEQEVTRAEAALGSSDWGDAVVQARAAAESIELGLLPGVEADWVDRERARFAELRLRALECVAVAGLAGGGDGPLAAEAAGRALVRAAPLHEAGHGHLMRALAERGRIGDALSVYDDVRRLLRDELGVTPGGPLRALHEELLARQDLPTASAAATRALATASTRPAPSSSAASASARWGASSAPTTNQTPAVVESTTTDAPAEDEASASIPFPSSLGTGPATTFVGRGADLQRLGLQLARAHDGARQVALCSGDPGIGKTRLAAELSREAHASGAAVLHGRCDEEPLLPFQPVIEALRAYVEAAPVAVLRDQVTTEAALLHHFVPALRRRLPDLPVPAARDEEGERYRFFDAISGLLARIARHRTVVLVLDDLHWADRPTLLLLRHLVRSTSGARLLVLGTYRASEVPEGGPLAETLATLHAEGDVERHHLGALGRDAVERLVRAHGGADAGAVVAQVFEQTAGNPFFVVESVRHLAETRRAAALAPQPVAAATSVPPGIADVIAHRISRLGPDASSVLAAAAVCGRTSQFELLQGVSDCSERALVEALDQALRARIVEEVPDAPGHYTFAHALVRATVYERLTPTRRALLHRRFAALLEERHASDLGPHRTELAHHYAKAGLVSDLERAVDHARHAGERALTQLAYESAAAHFRFAASLPGDGPLAQLRRCDLLIAQGDAERRASDPASRETLLEAARLATDAGDAGRLASAALANNRGFNSATAGADRDRIAVLEAALAAHDPADEAIRARLLATLAVELVPDPDWPRRRATAEEAFAIAKRLGDPAVLAHTAVLGYTALWGPATVQAREAMTSEALAVVDGTGDLFLESQARLTAAHVAMESGDLPRAHRLIDEADERAIRLAVPTQRWFVAVAQAKAAGIVGADTATEASIESAREIGTAAGQLDTGARDAVQLIVNRYLSGALRSQTSGLYLTAVQGTPPPSDEPTGSQSVPVAWEAAYLLILGEAGARVHLRDRLSDVVPKAAALPHDWAGLLTPAFLSTACARLADAASAATLFAMLEPHADQYVDAGPSWFGAVTHHLGVLAAVLGRHDEARDRLAEAADRYRAIGAEPWLARARLDLGRALANSPDAARRAEATAALRDALQDAARLDLPELAVTLRALLA